MISSLRHFRLRCGPLPGVHADLYLRGPAARSEAQAWGRHAQIPQVKTVVHIEQIARPILSDAADLRSTASNMALLSANGGGKYDGVVPMHALA